MREEKDEHEQEVEHTQSVHADTGGDHSRAEADLEGKCGEYIVLTKSIGYSVVLVQFSRKFQRLVTSKAIMPLLNYNNKMSVIR